MSKASKNLDINSRKESFDGDAWIGLVPAQVPHYNGTLNWQKHYARIWFRLRFMISNYQLGAKKMFEAQK